MLEAARQSNAPSCGGNGFVFNMHHSFLVSGFAGKLSEQVPSDGEWFLAGDDIVLPKHCTVSHGLT